MKVVGLTGGIATGKSTVSRLLAEHFPVVDADRIAREVVAPGQPAYRAILRHFADIPDLLLEDGQLNRARLGQVVFGDAQRRRTLNQCTHYYIRRRMLWEIIRYWLVGEPLIVLDVPLLMESRLDRFVATAVVVDCPTDMQLARLMARDNLSEAEAQQRIDAQLSRAAKRVRADFIVENDGSLDDLRARVQQLVQHVKPSHMLAWLCWLPPVGLAMAMMVLLWRALTRRRRQRIM
ncbi:dephospho-CoA kinase-domain-containing protein [Syncephalis pseudoplumigaleata]|uniref:Dephospho-CoA kinase-domain-containing protein n=1 Tax=Syncephalis pseudoplumigaleata TaxID=1712513 RepID=A0A4P9YYI6_9FUNG|nr:dephospho-CoA kinase-domain-containing protein [Syncephalis pseudoplumigaleata]|eukprot:RKP25028.1 dephospho-CoA kinase-domain-containing protein [Syncephalis pseudoplumigaleata]